MTSADTRPLTAARPAFTLPDRLRKAREFAGLEQSELAARTHISRNTIGSYEGGKVRPKMAYLMLWAQACGVDLEWLLDGDSPVTRQSHAPHNSPAVSTGCLPIQRLRGVDFIPSQQAA